MNDAIEAAAEKVREILIQLSPLLEEYTAGTCPECRDVCCRQRRCVPDRQDLRYRTALGMQFPAYDAARPPDGPCQFMGPEGCMTPRWLRPWRCTWYFCDPLLHALNNGPRKKARKVSELIQAIVDIRSAW